MRDDIHKSVKLGRRWNAAVRACGDDLTWQEAGPFHAVCALISDLKNFLSPAFDRAARRLPPLLSPAEQAVRLARWARSVLEQSVVTRFAALPQLLAPHQRYEEAVRQVLHERRDQVMRATEAVPDGGRVVAGRIEHVCNDETLSRLAADQAAGRDLVAPGKPSPLSFDIDLRGNL